MTQEAEPVSEPVIDDREPRRQEAPLPDRDFPPDDVRNDVRGATELVERAGPEEPVSAKAALHDEMRGPTGRAETTESFGDPHGPGGPGPATPPVTNADRPMNVPGSEGTGPVDPATDYVRLDD